MAQLEKIHAWVVDKLDYCPPILKTKTTMFLMYGYRYCLFQCEAPYAIIQCPNWFGMEYDEEVMMFFNDRRKVRVPFQTLKQYKPQYGWRNISKYTFIHPEIIDTLDERLRYEPETVHANEVHQPAPIILPERSPLISLEVGNVFELGYVRILPKTLRMIRNLSRRGPNIP